MKEIDIASFAEGILEEEINKGTPVQFAAPQSSDAPDVSEVTVPNDFAAQVLSEGRWDESELSGELPKVETTEISEPVLKEELEPKQSINEEGMYKRHLVNEYKKKVSDLQELVSLMESLGIVENFAAGGTTSVGSIGTNMAPTSKKKKKYKRGESIARRLNRRS